MTTYYQTTNTDHLVLPGNGGILFTSDNVIAKNQQNLDKVYTKVNEALERVKRALITINN
jgi:hypothetical protein